MTRRSFIFLLIALSSCRSGHQLIGKYVGKYGDRLQLSGDSTFAYAFSAFHSYEVSSGTWIRLNSRTLLLNSKIRSVTVPLKITEVKSEKPVNHLTVKLKIENGEELGDYVCQINVNGSHFRDVRCDSLTNIPIDLKVDSIRLWFFKQSNKVITNRIHRPLLSADYKVTRPFYNNIHMEVILDENHFSYRPFTNRRVKPSWGKIKLYDAGIQGYQLLKKVGDREVIFK